MSGGVKFSRESSGCEDRNDNDEAPGQISPGLQNHVNYGVSVVERTLRVQREPRDKFANLRPAGVKV